jgi:NAD-dependent deacetylase
MGMTIGIGRSDRLFVLTGAGISAESGIPTFRGQDGLWEGRRLEDVATPQAFT